MTQNANGGGTSTTATPTTTAAPATPNPTDNVTRADLEAFRTSFMADVTALLKRDDTAPATPVTPATTEPAPATPAATETLTRADVEKLMGDAIKPVSEAMEKLSGLTVVRSEGSTKTDDPNAKTNAKRGDDVFRGAFFGKQTPAE